MSDAFSAVAMTREQARDAAQRAYEHAQALLANGIHAEIACRPSTKPVSVKLRGLYHAAVLPQISEQAKVAGIRYVPDVWKEHFRKQFLPDHFERVKAIRIGADGHPEAYWTTRRIRSSTEELGNKLYAEHVDKVIAYAVTDLLVEFVFTNEERTLLTHKPKKEPA